MAAQVVLARMTDRRSPVSKILGFFPLLAFPLSGTVKLAKAYNTFRHGETGERRGA